MNSMPRGSSPLPMTRTRALSSLAGGSKFLGSDTSSLRQGPPGFMSLTVAITIFFFNAIFACGKRAQDIHCPQVNFLLGSQLILRQLHLDLQELGVHAVHQGIVLQRLLETTLINGPHKLVSYPLQSCSMLFLSRLTPKQCSETSTTRTHCYTLLLA